MVRLGNWSYAFYLVHATVIYAVMNVIGGRHGTGWSNLVWGAGIFLIALALSAAIHHLVEVPAERRIRGWKDRRDQQRSAVGAAASATRSSPEQEPEKHNEARERPRASRKHRAGNDD